MAFLKFYKHPKFDTVVANHPVSCIEHSIYNNDLTRFECISGTTGRQTVQILH